MAEHKFPGQANLAWNQSFAMTTNTPAIAKRIWSTYADALAFANDLDDTAIAGIILSVISDTDDKKNGLYRVVSVATAKGANDAVLEKVGAGDGLGSVVAATYEAAVAEYATTDNIGRLVYVQTSTGTGENVHPVGAYVVTGNGTMTILASGGDATILAGRVSALESKTTGISYNTDTATTSIDGKVSVNWESFLDESDGESLEAALASKADASTVESIGESVETLDASMAAAEAAIKVTDASVKALEASALVYDASIAAADASVKALEASALVYDASIAAADASVKALEASAAIYDASFEAIATASGKSDASINALESSVGELESSVGALESSVGALESSVGELERLATGITYSEGSGTVIDNVSIKDLDSSVKSLSTEVDKKIETVKVNDVSLVVTNHTVNIEIPAAAEYSIEKSTDSSAYAAVYHLTKDGSAIGEAINIPKDYLVKSGSIVNGTWTGDDFEEDPAGPDKALKFVVNVKDGSSTDEVIYINVKDLVDVYTGDNKTVSVSDSNVISVIMDESDGAVSYNTYSAAIEGVYDNLSDVRSDVNDHDASIKALDASVKVIDSSIAAIVASAGKADASINALEASALVYDASIAAIVASAGKADASINALEASALVYDASIAALDSSVKTIDASIAAIEAKPAMSITDASIAAWDAAASADVVNTFGGESGAITVLGGQVAAEDEAVVNLTMNGKQLEASIDGLGSAAYKDATVFAAAEHTHAISDVSGLSTALDGKVDNTITIAGNALTSNIDASTLVNSLGISEGANKVDVSYGAEDEVLYISIS